MNPAVSLSMKEADEIFHEAEYDINLKDCVYKDLLEYSEEYNNICSEISTVWKFCISFQVVFATGTIQCILSVKRMDDLLIPIKISFTMRLRDIKGTVGHLFHFQDTEVAGGQEIRMIFDPVISFRNLNPATYNTLKATVCFRIYGCHNCNLEREYSLSSRSGAGSRKIHFGEKFYNMIFKCFCFN